MTPTEMGTNWDSDAFLWGAEVGDGAEVLYGVVMWPCVAGPGRVVVCWCVVVMSGAVVLMGLGLVVVVEGTIVVEVPRVAVVCGDVVVWCGGTVLRGRQAEGGPSSLSLAGLRM